MKVLLKTISFCTGCFFIFLLAVGSYSSWFEAAQQHVESPYRYGDLYLFSNLHGYRIDVKSEKLAAPAYKKIKNTTLIIIGDSYLATLDPSFFKTETYRFIHWNNIPDTIPPPDRSKKNILIIETTERYARWRLVKELLLVTGKKKKTADAPEIRLLAEDNLQYMLTHSAWEVPFKELKAAIYLYGFDRFSSVTAKPDGSGRLYLDETTDPENPASSFNPVSDEEITAIVNNMNMLSDQCAKLSFDEIFFSIIPNAASIYKNGPYNQLIRRIELHPGARFSYIGIYDELKDEKNSVFYLNDSHWNHTGEMKWIIKANRQISN